MILFLKRSYMAVDPSGVRWSFSLNFWTDLLGCLGDRCWLLEDGEDLRSLHIWIRSQPILSSSWMPPYLIPGLGADELDNLLVIFPEQRDGLQELLVLLIWPTRILTDLPYAVTLEDLEYSYIEVGYGTLLKRYSELVAIAFDGVFRSRPHVLLYFGPVFPELFKRFIEPCLLFLSPMTDLLWKLKISFSFPLFKSVRKALHSRRQSVQGLQVFDLRF